MHESEKWKWSRSVVSTLSDPMDCSPPGSSVHGILQAWVLDWVPSPSPRFALFLRCLLTSFSWNSLPLSFPIPPLSILIWKHACPHYSVFGLSLFFCLLFTYSFFFNNHFYFLIRSLETFYFTCNSLFLFVSSGSFKVSLVCSIQRRIQLLCGFNSWKTTFSMS